MDRTAPRQCRHCSSKFRDLRKGRSAPRVYCSTECSALAAVQRLAVQRLSFGSCEVVDCTTRRRSANARWCEKHYSRVRHHDHPRPLTRRPNGACHHCGSPTARQRLFCSDLCRRRNRMRAPGRLLVCVVCEGPVPADARLDALYCSMACKQTAKRAAMYRIPVAELHQLLVSAELSGCRICGDRSGPLVIDHCHAANVVRGLLCATCNAGLGMFRDDPSQLRAAAAYLEAFNANRMEGKHPSVATS